jgi:hypothetical protein
MIPAVHTFIAWCGFLGAWPLVAGPLRQASRELEEEEIERYAAARAAVERRRSDEYRHHPQRSVRQRHAGLLGRGSGADSDSGEVD